MTNLDLSLVVIGAVMMFTAVILYGKDASKKALFPVILVIGGIFLCAAQTAKAKIRGMDLEFSRAVGEVSDKSEEMLLAQDAALKALADNVSKMRDAFDAYQKSANDRFAAFDAKPVAVPNQAAIAASAANVDSKLSEMVAARAPIEKANRDLGRIIMNPFYSGIPKFSGVKCI